MGVSHGVIGRIGVDEGHTETVLCLRCSDKHSQHSPLGFLMAVNQ